MLFFLRIQSRQTDKHSEESKMKSKSREILEILEENQPTTGKIYEANLPNPPEGALLQFTTQNYGTFKLAIIKEYEYDSLRGYWYVYLSKDKKKIAWDKILHSREIRDFEYSGVYELEGPPEDFVSQYDPDASTSHVFVKFV
jgi:hypothetical protein